MKFAHISDTHLGMEQYNQPEREQDMYDSFNQAIDISIKDHVDFVIFAGDIFQTPKPNGRAIITMANGLKQLLERNIDSFYILGDHDISRIKDTPIPYIYHNMGLSKYISYRDNHIIHKDILIAGFDNFKQYDLDSTISQFNKLDNITKQHKRSILVLHQGLQEFNKFGNFLTTNDLPTNFDYYAMGHLHNQDIREFPRLKGPVAYPGSTESSLTEGIKHNVTKGFYMVDITADTPTTEWIKLDTRPQLQFKINDINDINNIIPKLDHPKKPVIKLDIHGDISDDDIQELYKHTLHIKTEYIINNKDDIHQTSKPANIHEELLNQATKILDKPTAELAINDLMPAIQSNKGLQELESNYEVFQ